MIRLSRRSRYGPAVLATTLLSVGSAAGLMTAPHSIAAGEHLGEFSCRASVVNVQGKGALASVHIEPFVANNPNDPCTDGTAGALNLPLPTGPGDHVAVLNAQTVENEHARTRSTATSDARVVDAQVGGTLIRAQVLTAHAEGNDPDGLCNPEPATFSGNAHVASITIAGTTIPVDPAKNTDISLGPLGTLHLNQETTTPNGGIRERALFLETPLADVIISEAQVGPGANPDRRPCTPPGGQCPGQNGNDPNKTDPDNTNPFVDPTAERTRGQHPDCAPFSEPKGDGDNTDHDFVHFVRSINDTETSPNHSFVPVTTEDSRNRFNGKAGFFEDGDTSPSLEGDFYDDEDMHFRLAPLSIDAYLAPNDLAASPWRRFCGTGVIMPFADSSDGMDDDDVQPAPPFATGQVRKFLVETFDAKWLDDTRPGGDQSDYWVIDIYRPGSSFDTKQCDPSKGGRDHDDPENPNRSELDYHSEGQTIAGNIQIHSARVDDDDNDDSTSH